MRLMMFGVWDDKVGAFAPPFFAVAKGQASRMFGDWVNDPNTPLNRHPEDYRLHVLGEFDDQSGQVAGLPMPELVCIGVDHVQGDVRKESRGTR